MCKKVLSPVNEGMLYEIPAFGRECSDVELNKAITLQKFDEKVFEETHIFNGITLTLVFAMLLFLLALVILHCRNSHEENQLKKQ